MLNVYAKHIFLRPRSGGIPPPPRKILAFRSSEIDSDAIWANLGGKNRNHIQFAKITC